jgi:hypothetical protein
MVGLVLSLMSAPTATAAVAGMAVAVPDSAPDPAGAAQNAQLGHKRVLDDAATTETSQTFANPDGTWTMIEYAQPVRLRQAGNWVPIDTTLVRTGDTVAPKATVVSLALNPGGAGSSATPIVAAGTNGAQVGLTWPTDLPVPTLSGDTAIYPNVLPGVDLAVQAQPTGYAEALVIRTAAAAANPALAHLRFGQYTRNTTVAAVPGAGQGHSTRAQAPAPDGLRVTDRFGTVLFDGDASRMWDSSTPSPQLGPDGGHHEAAMGVQVAGDSITVSPDLGFLTDPATVYPVSLDPDNWCTACGIQHHDVVQSGYPDARNYDATGGALSTLKAGWESQDPAATSRSYIQMNTAPIAGTVVTSATLNTTVTHTWNCAGATTPTDLYLTNPIDGTTTWHNQPGWSYLISSNNTANCHDAANVTGQFDATRAATDAANNNWPNLTMVLAADNERNNVATWRLFALNPYLQVDYDSYPSTPTNLTMQNGTVGCVQGAGRPWVFTRNPQLAGLVSDPDGGSLDVAFGLDQGTVGNLVPGTHQTNNATTVVGTPGPNQSTNAGFTVPDGWIPQDGTYTWLMATTDGQLWSPGSTSCEFTVDSTVPLAPTVTMTGTAPATQGDPAHFTVNVGLATSGFYDIDHFIYTTDGSEPQPQSSPQAPAQQVALPDGSTGASATLNVTALEGNQNYIKIKAVNRAGTPGPDATCTASSGGGGLDPVSCSYHVLPLTPSTGLAGAWAFDELGGRNLADTANTTPGNGSLPPHPATLIGGGDWVPGYDHGDAWTHPDTGGYSDGPKGALTLDGSTAYAQASSQVLDTTRSFTVSAWAKLSDTSTSRTVVSQDGNQASGFYLQYSQADNAWALSIVAADAVNPSTVRALSYAPPQLNVWTHLVGTYDASTGAMTLYVNGVEQHTAVATGFATAGPLIVGAAKWNGNRVDYFAGQVDDVQAWQRVLSAPEAHDVASAAAPLAHVDLAEGCGAALTATPNNSVPSLDGYWAFGEGSGGTLHDTSAFGSDAALAGGYTWTAGHAGNAVHFDGSTGRASTAGPVLNTAQSFTVSAWVRPDDLNGYYAVVTQHGTKQDAFQLRYSKDVNRWIFGVTTSDDNSTDNYHWAIGATVPQAGVWTLVTGVFDSSAMNVKLYVNGKLDGTGTTPQVWNAGGTFGIGTAVSGENLFKGAIGQVQAWGQALTADQIAGLAGLSYIDTVSQNQGTAAGGVALGDEPDGNGNPTGCAALFDRTATGQVTFARPANLRTDRSYTVEAWAYHSWTAADATAGGAVDPTPRAVFGVDDSQFSPILLGYRPWNDANGNPHGKWSLLVSCSASQSCGWFELSDADAANNTWTHLAATYDAATGQITLYVNGVRQNTPEFVGTNAGTVGWNGSGQLFVGRGTWTGVHSDPWYGGVAGVRLYSGVRTQSQILGDRQADDLGALFGATH